VKRLTICLLVGAMMACPVLVFATAGTVTGTCNNYINSEIRTVTFAWTAASDSGTVPTKSTDAVTCAQGNLTASAFIQGYFLCSGETSTTVAHRPTDNYDIEFLDSLSLDKFGGGLHDRDSNSTEEAAPTILSGSTSAVGCRYITGPITLSITNNSNNAAAGSVTLFFSKP
jgi:hypothetical protein